MGLQLNKCHPPSIYLVGFSKNQVPVLGILPLQVRIGNDQQTVENTINFHVIDCPSTYNCILGRPFLHQVRAIPSTLHLKLKFPTISGVGCVKGDQALARQCCEFSLKDGFVATMEAKDEVARPVPVDPDEEHTLEEGRTVRVSMAWPKNYLRQLLSLMIEYKELFAQGPEDMPGLDSKVVEHTLGIIPGSKPIQQKRRNFAWERRQAIAEEVIKLGQAGFISEVLYPTWLANVVMVKKANGQWRMCVDFTDLNKACPKDPYPLPKIDLLIDATAGHCHLSLS
ncbi:unnamed protein product [Linum trigynum]|uniref:Uncharacterized protein n=1 Tax=Linum trigynum TaxID=586398 RepID=A0AAV2F5N3_9ROSI